MEKTACAKVQGQDLAWSVEGTVRRPCAWSSMRERERGREGGGKGTEGMGWEYWGFYPHEGGSPGGPWVERAESSSGARWCPLVAAAGRTDWRQQRAVRIALVQAGDPGA